MGKVQNKWWRILHQKSRTVKENNKLFISNITQHNKSYYSFLNFFFALLLYMSWTFWKPDSKLGSCSKHVEREQVVPMGISWKLSVLLSPQWTLHCRGKYITTLHEQQISRYLLSISLTWQIEKSWRDMKKRPYYIIGYVLMGEIIHIPCIYMQTMLQMLKTKRKKKGCMLDCLQCEFSFPCMGGTELNSFTYNWEERRCSRLWRWIPVT